MASATSEQRIGRVVDGEEEQQHDRGFDCDERHGVVASRKVSNRVSRLAVEGGGAGMNEAGRDQDGGSVVMSSAKQEEAVHGSRRSGGVFEGRTLPPPHAWLAIEDTKKHNDDSDPEEQWLRLLRGGGGGTGSRQQHQQRRSSFSVVRRERAAREAWLDRAWEMKRSWHERNGGAPDADTPVVVVVGKGHAAESSESSPPSPHHHHHHHHHAGAVGGGGVAMDVEEVRACRDLGLELPSDCTVEIQCYGLSGDSSPTHTTASSGADSPCAGISSLGADPMDVKARLKVWAQAVALTSTTQLGD